MLNISAPCAMRFPNGPGGGMHFIHVQFDEIAGETGEVYDVGFRDGSAARSADVVHNEIFEVQVKVASLVLIVTPHPVHAARSDEILDSPCGAHLLTAPSRSRLGNERRFAVR